MSQKVPIWEQNGTPQDMSHTPKFDLKVKTILDALKPGERVCALTGEKWMMTDEEIGWYKKFNVPPHSWSPLTRMKHMVSFFTMFQFWYQIHPETGKKFLTVVHPMTGIQALPDREWFGKDFSDRNQEYNGSKSFFQQIRELQIRVPIPGTKFYKEPSNSIALASFGDKNSYFAMASRSQNSFFVADVMDAENTCEASASTTVSNSYHVINSSRIFNCKFVHASYDCMDSDFIFDCRDCQYCFGATNKRHRKYLWLNEQLTQEEWKQRKATIDFSCRSKLENYQAQFEGLMRENTIWPENFNDRCTNVIGEYVNNAVDCHYVYNGLDGPFRDLYYVSYLFGSCFSNAFCGAPVNSNNCFYTNTPVQCSKVHFSHFLKDSQNCEYCLFCWNLENCFGCVGLQRKEFCIFNKQYSEDDYWRIVDEIKCTMLERGEYGNFFPLEMSESYFFDSGVYTIYAADQKDADLLQAPSYQPEDGGAVEVFAKGPTRHTDDVPDCIDNVTDEWIGVGIFDKTFGRRFAYLRPEIDFYKRMRLAAPAKHFIRRVYDLMVEANTAIFVDQMCVKCRQTITVAKSRRYPNRVVYCQKCYFEYLEKNG